MTEGTFTPAATLAARLGQQLGWTPEVFWAATPADLRHALGPLPEAVAAGGDVLRALMKEFPDG